MLGHSVLSFSLKDEIIFLKTLGGGDAEAEVHVKVWAVDRVFMVWLCSFNTCWAEMPFHVSVSRNMSGGSHSGKKKPAAWWRQALKSEGFDDGFDDCNQCPPVFQPDFNLYPFPCYGIHAFRVFPSVSCMIFIPLHGPGRGRPSMEKYFSTPLWAEVVTP